MRVARNMWRSSRASSSPAYVNGIFTATDDSTPTFEFEHFSSCTIFLNNKNTLRVCYSR